MKNILIDKKLLRYDNPKSEGLIGGLKKLRDHGYNLYIKEQNDLSPIIKKILRVERIPVKILSKNINEYDVISLSSFKNKNNTFESVVAKLLHVKRSATIIRDTKETKIKIIMDLDGNGKSKIKTGIGFFDHMLDQISRHANIDLFISVKGDLKVDEHHTVEDTGIALGEAIKKALGDKKGLKRFGFLLPMDDSIAECAIDLSGRNYLNFNCQFSREKVGGFPTELVEEFFRGVSLGSLANIYIRASGKNDHHKIESIFKSFAKALNEAARIDERAKGSLPSTKGKL